jgi:tetratricopeptide (TPR) repeat protein
VRVEFKSSKTPSFPKDKEGLSAALKNAEKICKRYGGTVENETKYGITAKFRDNPIGQTSAELAASAALEIKDHCTKKTPPSGETANPSVSIGIDCAKTSTTEVNAEISGEKSPTEGARRLSAKAPANTILISGGVAERIERVFVAKPLGFYKLRTHKVPQRLFELIDAKPSEPAVSDGTFEKTLVGRDDELNRLNLFLGEVEKVRTPSLAVISGSSGSGKTELLRRTVRDALVDGWRVVFAHGQEVNRFAPYYIWRGVYRKLLSAYEGLIPADEYVLSALEGDTGKFPITPLTPEETRSKIGDFLLDVVGRSASDVPTLIAIDDVHMSDYASLRFLNNLIETPLKTALAIIATSRESIASLRHPRLEIELREFGDDEAAKITKHFAEKSGLGRKTVANLYKQSGGNPLILEWLVKYNALNPGDVPGIADACHPLNIPDLAENRIEALDTGNLELLEFLYNIGEPISIPNLCPALGNYLGTKCTRLDDRVRWLIEFNLATVYKDSFGEYLGLRGYCQDSLNVRGVDTDPSAATRIIRFLEEERSGDDVLIGRCLLRYGGPNSALERFINAGKRAQSLGAELDAQSLFSVAIEMAESDGFAGPPETVASAYVKRADVLRKLGLSNSVLTDLRIAVERYGEHVPPGLRLDYAEALADSYEFDESLKNALAAVETLEAEEDPGLRARGLGLTGDVYLNAGQPVEAVDAYEEALRFYPPVDTKSALLLKRGLAKTMDCRINDGEIDFRESLETAPDNWATGVSLAAVLTDKGRFLGAFSSAETALSELAETYIRGLRPGDYEELSMALLLLSPLVYSPYVTDKASYIANRTDSAAFKVAGDYISAVRAYISGDPDGFNNALGKVEVIGDNLFARVIAGAKSLLKADFDLHYNEDFSSAGFYAKNALSAFEEVNFPYYIAECRLRLAEAAAGRGDLPTAQNELNNAVVRKKKLVSYPYFANYNRIFGKLLSLEGDTNRSSRFVNSAAVLYKSYGMALQKALCYMALADTSDPTEAAEYYLKATWLLENNGADRWVEKYGRMRPEKGFREETYVPTQAMTTQPNP